LEAGRMTGRISQEKQFERLRKGLEYLACPSDKAGLELDADPYLRNGRLVCGSCRKEYPIRNGLVFFQDTQYTGGPSGRMMYRLTCPEFNVCNTVEMAVRQGKDMCLQVVGRAMQWFIEEKGDKKEAIIGLNKMISQVIAKEKLSEKEQALLLESATVARYNLEEYSGTFTLPKEITDYIVQLGVGNRDVVGDKVIVEGACGPGECLSRLESSLNGGFYIGIDISENLLREAMKDMAGNKDVLLVQGDLTQLPLKDGSTGLYVVNNAWDRVPDPYTAAQEAGRVLSERWSGVVFSNCQPLQYEVQRDGAKIVYVPEDARVSLPLAVRVAGCRKMMDMEDVPWKIETILDGKEEFKNRVIFGVR